MSYDPCLDCKKPECNAKCPAYLVRELGTTQYPEAEG